MHGLGGDGDGQVLPVRYCQQMPVELLAAVGGVHDLRDGAPALRRPLLEQADAVAVAVGQVLQLRLSDRRGDRDDPALLGNVHSGTFIRLPTATTVAALLISCGPYPAAEVVEMPWISTKPSPVGGSMAKEVFRRAGSGVRNSAHAAAARRGVSRSPARSGSSPSAIRMWRYRFSAAGPRRPDCVGWCREQVRRGRSYGHSFGLPGPRPPPRGPGPAAAFGLEGVYNGGAGTSRAGRMANVRYDGKPAHARSSPQQADELRQITGRARIGHAPFAASPRRPIHDAVIWTAKF